MVDHTLTRPLRSDPPFYEPPLDARGTFSAEWVAWFTFVSERVALLSDLAGVSRRDEDAAAR
jgi:hypothetical protein